jgi:predicted esterase
MRNLLIGALVAAALAGVGGAAAQTHPGRLTARPGPGGGNCAPGVSTLRLGGGRTALLRVTPRRDGARRALLLALHGAGGSAEGGLWAFREGFRVPGLVLVAPASESLTWNPFYGSDIDSMNRALKQAFARCRIDPKRVAIGGFSDGATTALTVGLMNGDLFSAVVALSPGGVEAAQPVGKPRVFIAHGTHDTVLPIRQSNEIVRQLHAFGYSVTYRTFAGGHEVPPAISRAAVRWLLRR